MTFDGWKADSEKGLVCGVLDCTGKPTHLCRVCGNHYCEKHNEKHKHLMNTEEKRD